MQLIPVCSSTQSSTNRRLRWPRGAPNRPLHEHSPHLLNGDNDHGRNDTKANDNGKVRLKQSLRHRDGKFLGCAVTMGGLPAHSLARSHDLTCQA